MTGTSDWRRGATSTALSLALVLAALSPRTSFATVVTAVSETESHPTLGLTLTPPDGYARIASPFADPAVVLEYAEETPRPASDGTLVRGRLLVAWFDTVPPGPSEARLAAAGDPRADAPRANGGELARLAAAALAPLELGAAIVGEPRGDFAVAEHALKPAAGSTSVVRGWVCTLAHAERTIALVGLCADKDLVRQLAGWRRLAREIEIAERAPVSHAELAEHYAGRPYTEPALRIRMRKRLMPGWQAVDTPRYLIVHQAVDRDLLLRIRGEIEVVRAGYARLFPSSEEALALVRVCASEDEFRLHGGPEGVSGYWNAPLKELVFYVVDSGGLGRRDDLDTLGVLFHEGFHQYMSAAVGDLVPHPWYDEGHGDYFGAATVRSRELRPIGVNLGRVKRIRIAVYKRDHVPWKEFLRYDRAKYYADADLCYAQGWSIVYFLRTARIVAERAQWQRILPAYFESLQASWAEERARVRKAGIAEDPVERLTAGDAARARALDEAFRGVDLVEIESAWAEFVRRL